MYKCAELNDKSNKSRRVCMASDPPSSGPESVLNQIYNIFPSFKEDPDVSSWISGNLENISNNIPMIIEKIPFQQSNQHEYNETLKKYRNIQEQRVHDTIKEFKEIDFLEEVTKYNPEIQRAISESGDMNLALHRIMTESEERVETFKRELKARCDAILEEEKKDHETHFKEQGWEFNSQKCESEGDSLSFLDLKSLKRTHSDLGIDFDHEFRREEDRDIGTPNKNSKKIVLYSTSKRYVFGFDKVENLMEPSLIEDDLMVENGRDILREINNIHNYENNGASTFKFLNFT
jgi:hypothetical protein